MGATNVHTRPRAEALQHHPSSGADARGRAEKIEFPTTKIAPSVVPHIAVPF
jgi:hypothetical protein